jgi:hypothetical protein
MAAVFNLHFSNMTPATMPAPGYFNLNDNFNRNLGRAKRRRVELR